MEISLTNVNFPLKKGNSTLLPEIHLCLQTLKNNHYKESLGPKDLFWGGIFCPPLKLLRSFTIQKLSLLSQSIILLNQS